MAGAPPPSARLPWYTIAAAALILVGFTWLAYIMVDSAATLTEAERFRWDRLLLVFNVVQTLTVAAAGALLGTAVPSSLASPRRRRAPRPRTPPRARRGSTPRRLRLPGG